MTTTYENKITELTHRMEFIKKEMEEATRLEKIKQTQEAERALSTDPNMAYIKEWLGKTAIYKEYYESDDKNTHWIRDHVSHHGYSSHPKMKEFNTRTMVKEQELSKKISQRRAELNESARTRGRHEAAADCSDRREAAAIPIERARIQNEIKEDIINTRKYWANDWGPLGQVDIPNHPTIQFVESTYNMFNILTTQIQKINERLDK